MCKESLKYAKDIIRKGMQNPFYKILASETSSGVSLFFQDEDKNLVSLNYGGYYTIYRKVNNKLECLYVGKTNHTIYGRVSRWAKGIAGKLRHDECHSAATKAKDDGVTLDDELLIKVIDSETVDNIVDDIWYQYQPLDEWIAPLLKSKYNTKMWVYSASLEDFFTEGNT